MYIAWGKSDNYKIRIDETQYVLSDNQIDITIENGWHHLEVRREKRTRKEIIRLVIQNWVSCLLTSVPTYSIDNAFEDSCDQIITFDLLVNENVNIKTLNVDNPDPCFIIDNYSKEKITNHKLLTVIKCLYFVPMTILLFIVSGVFLWLGIISLKSYGLGVACFSIVLGSCFFALILAFLYKLIKKFKKLRK